MENITLLEWIFYGLTVYTCVGGLVVAEFRKEALVDYTLFRSHWIACQACHGDMSISPVG